MVANRKIRGHRRVKARPAGKADAGTRSPAAAAEKLRAVQLELRRLRSLVREIASRYLQKQETRIARVTEMLADLDGTDQALIAELLRDLRGLDVKAHKGRRKDLAQIETLTKSQYERLVRKLEEQEKREAR